MLLFFAFRGRGVFLFTCWLGASSLLAAPLKPLVIEPPTKATGKEKPSFFRTRQVDDLDNDPSARRFSLSLGVGSPTFSKLSYYDELYGKTAWVPDLRVNFDVIRLPWVAVQAGMGAQFYTDRGYEIKYPSDPDAAFELTDNRLILNLMPYRFLLGAMITPFDTSYLAFGGWVGYEELYFTETRSSPDAGTASATVPTTSPTPVPQTTNPDNGVFVNSGWNAAMIYGVAAHIMISWIEETNVRSMSGTLDISHIYISPYYEVTVNSPLGKTVLTRKEVSRVNFQRQTFGLAFTFSTAR